MSSIEMIQALLLEIHFYTSNDEDIARVLGHVLVEGQVNTNALKNLEELLIQKQMRNVLQLMRQTLRGKMRKSDCSDNAFKFSWQTFFRSCNR